MTASSAICESFAALNDGVDSTDVAGLKAGCDAALSRRLHLLERYGAPQLQAAIRDALASGVPHPNAVRLAHERRREARHRRGGLVAPGF